MRTIMTLLLLGWLSAACAADAAPAKGAFLGGVETEYPTWFKASFLDLRADVGEAKVAGKRVLLLFTQDNCPYCHLLVTRNLAQRDIEHTLRTRFDVIRINMWGDQEVTGLDGQRYTEKTFAAANKVQFTPTLLFLDENGEVVLRLNGYTPPARFKAALDWVANRDEHKQPFRDYVAGLEKTSAGDGKLMAEPYFKPLTDLRRKGKPAKPLAVFFEQKDCPDCVTLHARVLADPEVRLQLARFDDVQLDMWSREPIVTPSGEKTTVRDWARQLDVKYAPSIVLFDASGHEVIRWESGFRVFHTAGMFDYVASGADKTEPSFQRYLSARAEKIRESGRDVNIWRYADEPLKPAR
ncbi:MAG TPA: thioredoxin fold domain-containing protein [Parasulfuritortus sp.]